VYWVSNQRVAARRKSLPSHRKQLLKRLGFDFGSQTPVKRHRGGGDDEEDVADADEDEDDPEFENPQQFREDSDVNSDSDNGSMESSEGLPASDGLADSAGGSGLFAGSEARSLLNMSPPFPLEDQGLMVDRGIQLNQLEAEANMPQHISPTQDISNVNYFDEEEDRRNSGFAPTETVSTSAEMSIRSVVDL